MPALELVVGKSRIVLSLPHREALLIVMRLAAISVASMGLAAQPTLPGPPSRYCKGEDGHNTEMPPVIRIGFSTPSRAQEFLAVV